MAPGSPDMLQPNWKILQKHNNSLFFSYSILKELQENLPDSVRQAKNNGPTKIRNEAKWSEMKRNEYEMKRNEDKMKRNEDKMKRNEAE